MKSPSFFPGMLLAVALLAGTPSATAATYYSVALDELKIEEGEIPSPPAQNQVATWRTWSEKRPYVRMDQTVEAYLDYGMVEDRRWWRVRSTPQRLVVKAGDDRPLTGQLFWAKVDARGMVRVRFKLDSDQSSAEARRDFYEGKQRHYQGLLEQDLPGAAWYRHQQRMAQAELGRESVDPATQRQRRPRQSASNLDETFAFFTGGRAIAENLQLRRVWQSAGADSPSVAIKDLTGITVQPMEWGELLGEAKPELDPLAKWIPSDQHAVFFPSFEALVRLLDEAQFHGAPILQSIEPQAQDARSSERYQQQLCLRLSEMARVVGPQLIRSVALTGSDPFLRTGSDVAVLLAAADARVLAGVIRATQTAALASHPGAKVVTRDLGPFQAQGVVTPDRRICSYLVVRDNWVMVANSEVPLKKLARLLKAEVESLAATEEYRFFRQKYPREGDEETAFLFLPDAAIRRWCGPHWRIGASRRNRAAAVLAEMQATHLRALVQGVDKASEIAAAYPLPEGGQLHLTSNAVVSEVYGHLDFLTPISELEIEKVTEAEAAAYRRYRDRYQDNWRRYFDPIAIRLEVSDTRLAAAVSVIPLIGGSEYRNLVEMTADRVLEPSSGDPHPEALLHWVWAMNAASEPVQRAGRFVSTMVPQLKANALAWLGDSVSFYVDEDPVWTAVNERESFQDFLSEHYHELPIALRAEVKNPLLLTAFLGSLRAYVQQTAPNVTIWDNLEHQGATYVRIRPAGVLEQQVGREEFAIYYLVQPDSLLLTLKQDLVHRAIERALSEPAGVVDSPGWLGQHVGLRVKQDCMKAIVALTFSDWERQMRDLSWKNLLILNEWRLLFPGLDPVELHERYWQHRLVCPGEGEYIWNETWQTMESTAFGHPAEPKSLEGLPPVLSRLRSGEFGITFEYDGLSARGVVSREPIRRSGRPTR